MRKETSKIIFEILRWIVCALSILGIVLLALSPKNTFSIPFLVVLALFFIFLPLHSFFRNKLHND